jgi:hypothetical protein
MILCRRRTGDRWQREAVKADAGLAGGGLHQPHELPLGRLQRAVGHVVDKTDREIGLAGVLELVLGRRQRD